MWLYVVKGNRPCWNSCGHMKKPLTWIRFPGSCIEILTQSNFDSQWIAGQAKDGLNSVGIGAWFNVLNPGQMLMWHIVLLPLVVVVITLAHVILVRRHGVVPPIDAVLEGE